MVESFWVNVFKYEDLGIILGILGFYAYQTGYKPEAQFVPKNHISKIFHSESKNQNQINRG